LGASSIERFVLDGWDTTALPIKAQFSDVFWASGRSLGQRDAKQQIAGAEFD
jgi:hypothetical protein